MLECVTTMLVPESAPKRHSIHETLVPQDVAESRLSLLLVLVAITRLGRRVAVR